MKGTNTVTTICGCGAAVFGALASVVPDKYKVACAVLAAAFGAAFGYFSKGKDVTGTGK